MGKAKAKPATALHIVEAPSEPDELTLLTSKLVLEVNSALVRIPRLQGLTPRRSARAEVLAQLLKNVRIALLDS